MGAKTIKNKCNGLFYTETVLNKEMIPISKFIFDNKCCFVKEANQYIIYLEESSLGSYNSIKLVAEDICNFYNYVTLIKKKLHELLVEDIDKFIEYLMNIQVRNESEKTNKVEIIKKNKYSIEKTLYTKIPFVKDYRNRNVVYLRAALGLCDSSINRIYIRSLSFLKYLNDKVDYRFSEKLKLMINNNIKRKNKLVSNGISIEQDQIKPIEKDVVFKMEELELLNCWADTDCERLVYFIMKTTGMRIGEVLGLKIFNVDLINIKSIMGDIFYENDGWHIKTVWRPENNYYCRAKSHKNRECILLDDEVFEFELIMERYLKYRKNKVKNSGKEWLFISNRGNQLCQNTIYKQFKRTLIKSNLSHRKTLTLHSYRHTWATQEILKGTSLVSISKQLGHKYLETTYKTYIHFLPEDLLKAREKYEKYMEW